jgi:hypothetical protein
MTAGFKFGLESEFMLASTRDFRPLWYKDVTFKTLDAIFEGISLEGIPSLAGLHAEPPHAKLMPFIVEGYGLPDADFKITDAYPKGIEIRTPVCASLPEVLRVYETLYGRVKTALAAHELVPIAISHHPIESKFSGPQNKRRHDFWLWAMEVMTTYGPDVNVSLPKEISDRLFGDVEDLNAKVNYYAPALAAISLASPFYQGDVWNHKGTPGKSYRTFKRSVVAPAIELHADEDFRIEFKVFEMSKHVADFECYFLLVLALFLDDGLRGRAGNQERIYDSGAVARFGLLAEGMHYRFSELYDRAFDVLPRFGFDPAPLARLAPRIEANRSPADEMIERYRETNSLNAVMKEFSYLVTAAGDRI